ncbi:MAG: CPA1 family monovalent cation:H+ antiporter [Candidatus Azotimanducaceae bacterium]|jgi:CPA1 family monovalent cation:H+ antiporter
MEHDLVQIAELVTGITLLMLIAAITTMLSKHVSKLPLTIALVFVGVGVSYASHNVDAFHSLAEFTLSPELVLFVFIPTLIFESAFNLNARQVGRNILPILTLAVPGLLISTAIIGTIFAFFSPFSLLVALLLGAILSATDPVAVISIFKQLGVPDRLTVLVEGESLLNDATSLVLATLLIGILSAGTFSSGVILGGIGEFFIVFFGGAFVGWLLAVITGQVLGSIESDPDIEITLSTILAYFSFIIAEHVFHVSGIMAVVAAGMVIGSWGKSKISPSSVSFMEHFWEYLAYLANVLIFIMVGMQIELATLWTNIDLILLVVCGMLISRAVVVFGVVPLVGKFPGSEPIGLPYQMVMYWGGLRGAIALAIVLSLPPFEYKDTLIAVVMGAVLFTLIVQGLSIEILVKKLGLNKLSVADNLSQLEGDRKARIEGLSRLNTLVDTGLFSQRIADNMREKGQKEIEDIGTEVKELHQMMDASSMINTLALRCLVREKARYSELFSQGLINEWAYRELDHNTDVQIDGVRYSNSLPGPSINISISKRFSLITMSILDYIPGAGSILENLRTQWIVRDYGVAWGRYRATQSVLAGINGIAGDEIDGDTESKIKAVYNNITDHSKGIIDDFGEQFPEFVETMQEQLGQRLMLIAERDSVKQSAGLGMVPSGIAGKILKDQAERIRMLAKDNMTAYFEISVDELLGKVPLFAELDSDLYPLIAKYLRAKTVATGTNIIKQGQSGDSMFLIARGIANVTVSENGTDKKVASLYPGDFFGESALLHKSPRNATATAATPCSCYELKRIDLDKICEAYPEIRKGVELVDEQRLKANASE